MAIIGAGRLGRALGIALNKSGYKVVALVARHQPKVRKGENFGSVSPALLSTKQLGALPAARLIIIATPDDAIEATASKLSQVLSEGTTVLHTSGALSSASLSPLAEREMETGSLHPLLSVSDPVSAADAFRGAYFCIEGTRLARIAASRIVRDLGGQSFTIKASEKALYHAAAVMASPHVTALFDLAVDLLAQCGLSKQQAQKVLMPLLESTVNNLRSSNTSQALTGTFVRGDIATVRRHLDALSKSQRAEALTVYLALGLHSLAMTELGKKTREGIEELLKVHFEFESTT